MAFYFQGNYFESCTDDMQISQDKLTVTHVGDVSKEKTFAINGWHQLSISNIPMNIFYLCLWFYFQSDYSESCDDDMIVSTDKLTMTHVTESVIDFV